MLFTPWLSNGRGPSFQPASRRKTLAARRSAGPRLECLEDRRLLSTLTVTNNLDSGPGSLRAEIAVAQHDTIVFAPSLDGQTITLTSGELLIKKNLTIAGPSDRGLTISGNDASRGVRGGPKGERHPERPDDQPRPRGGGIVNFGTLTVSNCTLSGQHRATKAAASTTTAR